MKLCRASLQERYLALSYVWGQNTEPVLVKSNENALSQPAGISIELLPKTIADAMELTRRLEQRFLWVDSVCIIQDSETDKQAQISLMDSIYNLAEIVIVAADSKTAHSGLRGILDRRNRVVRPTVFVQGHGFTTASPTLEGSLGTSVWNSRGWTFQEGLLARRLLFIFDSQVYWSCHKAAYCEDRFTEFDNANPLPTYHNLLFGTPPVEPCSGLKSVDVSFLACHLWDYAAKVQIFMSRQLTNPNDALWAFLGVLRLLKPHFPRGYIWGIPWDSIDAMLLWDTDCDFTHISAFHTISGRDGKPQNILFPSWSWFAKGCNLRYDTCGCWVVSKVKWHEPISYGNSYEVPETCPYGRFHYSKPTILGPPDKSKSENGQRTSDFGYLQFDAQTAILTIEFLGMAKRHLFCQHEVQTQAWANLLLPDNNCIGLIKCTFPAFALLTKKDDEFTVRPGDKVEAEFVHLSTNRFARNEAGEKVFCQEHDVVEQKGRNTHVPGCDFAANVNLMMIQWDDDHKVAFRVGITRVQDEDWAKVETRQQRIVLG
ncbi:heterokaryon incompatibility protein-domain-containing protein [Xylaria arbuscula]|nr:heterokaryon incompatibility protein-domain-containing protein [Xylaria arbuscula]